MRAAFSSLSEARSKAGSSAAGSSAAAGSSHIHTLEAATFDDAGWSIIVGAKPAGSDGVRRERRNADGNRRRMTHPPRRRSTQR
eukprot:1825978-Prymnesium_polylepis.1